MDILVTLLRQIRQAPAPVNRPSAALWLGRLLRKWRRRPWPTQRLGHLALAVLLGLAVVGSPARPVAAGRLQPALAQLAAQAPGQAVRVIVQKADRTAAAEAYLARLGGVITQDLSLINAFAAELPAGAAPELARHATVKWVSLDAPVQTAGTTKFTTWATKGGTAVANGFTNSANLLSSVGPNDTYAYGGRVKTAVGGFQPQYAPGQAIKNVEVAIRLYLSTSLTSSEAPKLTAYVGGQAGVAVAMPTASLNSCVGVAKVCQTYVDITASRAWSWADFSSLEIVIDQSAVGRSKTIYYDAVGVRIATSDGSDGATPLMFSSEDDTAAVNTAVLANVFQASTRAINIWNEAPYWQGAGVTVAVVDSGSFRTNAIGARFIGEVNFNSTEQTANDRYGHGTFVTGLVADDGEFSAGKYMGIAPRANVLGVRVSDDAGMSYESDVVAALQWIYANHVAYNIRVVNLSLNSAVWQSYHTSPLCAAVEILWFNGVVVVASAGNNGTATLYPPANDPFVITVGAVDDLNTATLADDVIASFSAYGLDETGRVKPDLVTPGKNLIAFLPDTQQLAIAQQHPANRVDANYFRMSGTSMAAPLVSGATAILLEANPTLTPDQVKYRLMATANKNWPGYVAAKAGAGYLDVYAAVKGTTTQSANTGLSASQLLWTGSNPVTWGSVNWNSVNWNSVNWNSVNWNSVNWNSVNWNSDYWGN